MVSPPPPSSPPSPPSPPSPSMVVYTGRCMRGQLVLACVWLGSWHSMDQSQKRNPVIGNFFCVLEMIARQVCRQPVWLGSGSRGSTDINASRRMIQWRRTPENGSLVATTMVRLQHKPTGAECPGYQSIPLIPVFPIVPEKNSGSSKKAGG